MDSMTKHSLIPAPPSAPNGEPPIAPRTKKPWRAPILQNLTIQNETGSGGIINNDGFATYS